jgi:hypothetical protein
VKPAAIDEIVPVTVDEIVPLERYARIRRAYREAVIEHKRHRRLPVGDKVTLLFEDRETLRFQIQEMLWIERISDRAKVQDEIDVYSELLPGRHELSATLMVEITDALHIRPELDRLVGVDEHVALVLGEAGDERRVRAHFDPKQAEEDRISAVQYIRFRLDPEAASRFGDPAVPARIVIDHPAYRCEAEIAGPVRESLRSGLAAPPPSLVPTDDAPRTDDAPPEPESALRLLFETPQARARLLPPAPDGARVVVEARAAGSLLAADAELLAGVLEAVKRASASLVREHGSCRVWTELGRDGGPMRWYLHAPAP